MNMTPLEAVGLYLLIALVCALPLRVAGTTWTYAITRGACVPLALVVLWIITALAFCL